MTTQHPTVWQKYADNVLLLWLHQGAVQLLLDYGKSIWPSIQFTMEGENNNHLAFLHVLIIHTKNSFKISECRNTTFTRKYISINLRKEVVQCLQHRKNPMQHSCQNNNYPRNITSTSHKRKWKVQRRGVGNCHDLSSLRQKLIGKDLCSIHQHNIQNSSTQRRNLCLSKHKIVNMTKIPTFAFVAKNTNVNSRTSKCRNVWQDNGIMDEWPCMKENDSHIIRVNIICGPG